MVEVGNRSLGVLLGKIKLILLRKNLTELGAAARYFLIFSLRFLVTNLNCYEFAICQFSGKIGLK
jgi:hypothetical protein